MADSVSVVAYNGQVDSTLAQTQISTLGGLGGTMTAINALTPRGATDIRDAFFRSRDQDRVAADSRGRPGVLLLTDGVHNFRFGSSRLEAPPDLLERGIRVYALGVGTRPTSTWPRSARWRPARAGRPTR